MSETGTGTTPHPDTMVIEMTATGRIGASGAPQELSYVVVLEALQTP